MLNVWLKDKKTIGIHTINNYLKGHVQGVGRAIFNCYNFWGFFRFRICVLLLMCVLLYTAYIRIDLNYVYFSYRLVTQVRTSDAQFVTFFNLNFKFCVRHGSATEGLLRRHHVYKINSTTSDILPLVQALGWGRAESGRGPFAI